MTHQEPWRIGVIIGDGEDAIVTIEPVMVLVQPPDAVAVAKRIVACVNGFAGVPDIDVDLAARSFNARFHGGAL